MESDKRSSLARAYVRNKTSIYELVFRFFNDNKSPRLAEDSEPNARGVSPRDMVRMGRYDRLLRFVTQAHRRRVAQLPRCDGGEYELRPDEKLPSERQESIEEAWYREIERRASELDSRTAETIPWELVSARLRALRS